MTEKSQEQFNSEMEREKIEIAEKKIRDLKKQLEEVKGARLNNPSVAVDDYKDTEKLIASRIESLEEIIRKTKEKIQ